MTSWISGYFFAANVHSSSSSTIASFHRPTSSLKVSIFLSNSSSFSRYRSMASSFLSKLSNARSIVLAHAACNCACGNYAPRMISSTRRTPLATPSSDPYYSFILGYYGGKTVDNNNNKNKSKTKIVFVALTASFCSSSSLFVCRLCSLFLRYNTSMSE